MINVITLSTLFVSFLLFVLGWFIATRWERPGSPRDLIMPVFQNMVPLSSFLLPLVVLIPVTIVAFTSPSSTKPADEVQLPIRLLLPNQETTSVEITASNGSDTDSLYLKTHQIGYPYYEDFSVNKASIRINEGNWVDITNSIATCNYPERELDCIEGPYPVIRFEIAASDLGTFRDGSNTVDFRINYAFAEDSPDDFGSKSTAYRILDIEFRTSGDTDLIDGTTFSLDDPSEWSAPSGASASNGETLWNQRNLLQPNWTENGSELTASCADCHHRDGRDLQYFAFSNSEIINRSEFHGLSNEQAKDIAAYIRNVRLEDIDTGYTYDPPARPWTPVYQPGPSSRASRSETAPRDRGTPIHEMPSNGSQYWAAGAGLDWSLDHDRETIPYLFPDGASYNDVRPDSSLKMWHIPVAIQFADWNEWLPAHHPLDIWGEEFKNRQPGPRNESPWAAYYAEPGEHDKSRYQDFVRCFEQNGGLESCRWEASVAAYGLYNQAEMWSRFRDDSWVNSDYRDMTTQAEYGYQSANLMKWASVKSWELQHTYDLADEKEGSSYDQLQWFTKPGSNARNPFEIAPHVSGPGGDREWAGPEKGSYDLWLDNVWYEVNTRINHGRGAGVGIRPNDWKYQHQHISEYGRFNIPQYARWITSFVKVTQNCESLDQNLGVPKAWYSRPGHCNLPATEATYGVDAREGLNSYRSGLGDKAYTLIFQGYVEFMMYKYSPNLVENIDAEWSRMTGEKGWEPSDFEPSFDDPHHGADYTPSHYLRALDRFNNWGMRETLLDSAAVWLDGMNPSEKWDAYKCQDNGGALDCSAPPSQTLQLHPGWNFVSSRIAPSDSAMEQLFSGSERPSVVKDRSGQAYFPDRGVNELGTWSTSEGYKVHVEEAQEKTLKGTPVDPDTPIELRRGWNLLPFYPRDPMDAATALAPIEDAITIARDEDGNEYKPSGSNGIGEMIPGDSYAVYVTRDVTFVYPVESN